MIHLAAISLAAPAMLLGIAAVALPIAAHLMNRRTRQRLVFPTIRLLAESRATQSSLYRIRRWILLILRCLALALIAFAFTMPSCTPQAQVDQPQSQARGASVVLVLDVSASLAREVQGVNLLNTMKATAQRALSALTAGEDRANIIYAGARPRAAFAHQAGRMSLSTNLDALRDDLNALSATQERADLPAALALAGEMLRHAPAAQQRIVIISDMQQTNWREVTLTAGAGALAPRGTVITVLPLEAGEAGNVSLSDVRAEPIHPVVNQQAMLIVKATNHGTQPREVTVAATLDGQPIGSRAIALGAGESRDIGFETVIAGPGRRRVAFELPDDALAADNRAYLSITAVRRSPVFIVGDDDAAELGSASYFLSRALAPRGDEGDFIEVRQLTSADLAEADLAGAEAVFIGQVAALPPKGAEAVVEYLQRGGGVVLFSGDGPVPSNFAALEAAARSAEGEASDAGDAGEATAVQRVTPWTPMVLRELEAAGEELRITEGQWNSPLLTEFDEQSRLAMSRIGFGRVWSIGDVNPAAAALLRFNDGTPALSVVAVGEGRLVAASFSPALSSSDVGKYGSFVALTHSLARYVRPKRDWRSQAIVGEPVVASAAIPVGESPGRFVVEGPAGKMFTPDLARFGSRMTIAVDRAAAAGFYRALRNDQPVAEVALNIDPREGDLRPLDAASIEQQLQAPGITLEVKGQSTTGDILDVRGQPLWHWFILAAMLMIALELVLLAVWNR